MIRTPVLAAFPYAGNGNREHCRNDHIMMDRDHFSIADPNVILAFVPLAMTYQIECGRSAIRECDVCDYDRNASCVVLLTGQERTLREPPQIFTPHRDEVHYANGRSTVIQTLRD
jgi:hypothetical protein